MTDKKLQPADEKYAIVLGIYFWKRINIKEIAQIVHVTEKDPHQMEEWRWMGHHV